MAEEHAPGTYASGLHGDHHQPSVEQPQPPGEEQATEQSEAVDAGRTRALELAAMFAARAGQVPVGASDSLKRKFDGEQDSQDCKRPAGMSFADAGASMTSVPFLGGDSGTATEIIMCPADKVGRVIGRAGATIRDLEASTSTRVQVDHKAPGEKPVTISGRHDDVERAKRTVLDLIAGHGEPAPVTGEVHKVLECPQGIVGRVIGRGGETIRTLQQASGAHILVNQDFPDGVPRQITISGTQDAVDRATSMVTELVGGEHANTQAVIQRFGVGSTEILECPKTMVGRIIGKGGETIKDLQKRFNASIQIDQTCSPCKVTVTGPSHMIASARRAIEDLIRATSAPPMGAPRPGPYNAPYGQQPYSGSSGSYGGYGGFGAPAAGYGAPGYSAYGGYPGTYPGAAPYAPPSSDPYAGGSSYNYPSAGTNGGSASPWQALQDDQGRTYYYNSQTGVSQWERPAEMQ